MKILYFKTFYYKLLCLLIAVCLLESTAFAQSRTVSGKVTSSEGDALPGVNVLVKNTSNGTVTDVDGNYSLSVEENVSLVFSYVGYLAEEVVVGNQSVINVTLDPNMETLSEVVVIGYGEREKKDLTGSISTVNADEIARTKSMSPQFALQGRTPGVFVSTPGGDPGARPNVQIRGVTTFGENNSQPLYVVDGVPITEFGNEAVAGNPDSRVNDLRGGQNIFNLINPNDIESISVLKDASSAAVYGVRGANGVVLITTKRGKGIQDRLRVSLDISTGIQNVPKTYDVLNTQQFEELYREAYANNVDADGVQIEPTPDIFIPGTEEYLGGVPATDWQRELVNRNAPIHDYSIGISGNTGVSNYSVSAGYSKMESTLKYNETERYTLSLNSDHKIKDWFRVGQTFRFSFLKGTSNRGNNDLTIHRAAPWQPIYDPNGLNGYAPAYNGNERLYGEQTRANNFGISSLDDSYDRMFQTMGSVYAEVEPLQGLKLRGTVSGDRYDRNQNRFTDGRSRGYFTNSGRNTHEFRNRTIDNMNLIGELSLAYDRSFGNHNLNLLVNASSQEYSATVEQLVDQAVLSSLPGIRDRVSEGNGVGFYEGTKNSLIGYLGRASYNYNQKYYIDAVVRRDGSSKFGPGYKWGTFPSLSAAWRLTEEFFMQGQRLITDLKIRGGWGQLGNDKVAPFAYLSLLNMNPRYSFGNQIVEAVTFDQYPTTDLTWEVVTTTNIAFDAVILKNIEFTAEYYTRKTEGILQSVPLPATTGNLAAAVFNIADVENKGFEFQLGYNGQVSQDFTYYISGNLTTVRNRVSHIYDSQPFENNNLRTEVGEPINFIYGYKTDGIFQTQEEINEFQATTEDPGNDASKSPGDVRFVDLYGAPDDENPIRTYAPDGKINTNDRTYLGKVIPGYYYGINLGGAFKGFDLAVTLQGVGDVQKINDVRRSSENMQSTGINQLTTVLDRWTPENPSTSMPRAVFGDPSGNNRFSDRFVEDAGFLRVRNVVLGYSLPSSLIQAANITNFRIYLTGNNLATFTNYSGVDPENDLVPPGRAFIVGANISF